MIPRRLRLSREDIGHFKAQKRVSSPHFVVSVGPGTGAVVIISKKVAKLSVVRHLLKRRVLSLVLPYLNKQALLITLRPGAAALSKAAFAAELTELLQKT